MSDELTYSEMLAQADRLKSTLLKNVDSIKRAHRGGSDNPSVMKFTSIKSLRDPSKRGRFLRRYVDKCVKRNLWPYLDDTSRIPLDFQSNEDAVRYLAALTKEHRAWMVAQGLLRTNARFRREDVIEILVKSRLAMTTMYDTITRQRSLLVYDYDRKIYLSDEKQLSQYITTIMSYVDNTILSSVMMSLVAYHDKLAVYNPPTEWQLPVANGVLNLLTNQVDPCTPLLTVLSRIDTPYDPDAREPEFSNGMTFERFVDEFANHDPNRFKLVMQVLKSAVLGYSPVPAFVQIVGPGGDGKSTLMKLLTNIVGENNVSHATITDLGTDDGLRSFAGRHVNIGMDNGETYITNKTIEMFKKLSTNEPIIVSRKYLDAMVVQFRGMLIQVTNKPFRFQEQGPSIDRRVITIKADNNFYSNNTVDREIEQIVKDPRWHRYILRYLVERVEFFDDFVDIDRDVLINTLDADDPIGSFCSEMLEEGVFDELSVLPVRLVYAAYADWHNRNVSGSSMYSSRSFTNAFTTKMRQYGYEIRTSKRRRVRSIESISDTDYREVFKSFAEGDAFNQLYESNMMSPIIERDALTDGSRVRQNSRRGRRDSHWCSALEYYKLEVALDSDITSEYESYLDLVEEMFSPSEYSIEVFDVPTLQMNDSADYLAAYLDSTESLEIASPSPTSIKSEFESYYDGTATTRKTENRSSVGDDELESQIMDMSIDELSSKIDLYIDGSNASRLEKVCVMEELDRRLRIDTSDYELDQRAAKLKVELANKAGK